MPCCAGSGEAGGGTRWGDADRSAGTSGAADTGAAAALDVNRLELPPFPRLREAIALSRADDTAAAAASCTARLTSSGFRLTIRFETVCDCCRCCEPSAEASTTRASRSLAKPLNSTLSLASLARISRRRVSEMDAGRVTAGATTVSLGSLLVCACCRRAVNDLEALASASNKAGISEFAFKTTNDMCLSNGNHLGVIAHHHQVVLVLPALPEYRPQSYRLYEHGSSLTRVLVQPCRRAVIHRRTRPTANRITAHAAVAFSSDKNKQRNTAYSLVYYFHVYHTGI